MTIEITNVGIKGPKGDTGSSGLPLLDTSAISIGLINPLTTFTSITASNDGAGKTRLTSSGSHGLAAADAIGVSIYVISGTGWPAGFKKILALDADNGNSITVDVPWASQGSPTVAVGTAQIGLLSVTLPILGNNSLVEIDCSFGLKNSTLEKKAQFRLNGLLFFQSESMANSGSCHVSGGFQNRGSANSQIGFAGDNSVGGVGTAVGDIRVLSVDTSIVQRLSILAMPAAAEPYIIQRYKINTYV